MDIFDFGRIIGGEDEEVLKYFQEHSFVHRGAECQPCGQMTSQIKWEVQQRDTCYVVGAADGKSH